MTIHGAVVMDFLFIQPFGWIRIACRRRIRVISIWSPHCEVCGDHKYAFVQEIQSGWEFQVQGHWVKVKGHIATINYVM
jgi:hypothetical protein